MIDVSLVPCATYTPGEIESALRAVLAPVGGLDFVVPGMTVGIKANLVSAMKPEDAATTHPALLCALVRMLKAAGAGRVIVGDSPGGLFTAAYVGHIYKVTGMEAIEEAGGELNRNFGQKSAVYPEGQVLKSLTYTAWLDECDALIDFCKLKTHGMMGMSAAAKNMFGVIPGTTKPEYHFRFPNHTDFSRMIVDLDTRFTPCLCLCDAVEGMEGNGPTQGTPRHIGALLASHSPHKMDLVCAAMIGLGIGDVPTLGAARERDLIPDSADALCLNTPLAPFLIADYQNVACQSMLFDRKSKLFGKIAKAALSSRPALHKSTCVGCGLCARICPANAIRMHKKNPVIDRRVCIRCFCCQEFCPKGAMRVHRPLVARLINH